MDYSNIYIIYYSVFVLKQINKKTMKRGGVKRHEYPLDYDILYNIILMNTIYNISNNYNYNYNL